jgi:AraC-like DNA-binding protein
VFPASLSKGERKEIKRRNFYGLTAAASGEIVYTLNKKEHISDKGHFLILPKGQTYSLHCTESGVFPVVNFEIVNTQSYSQIMPFQVSDKLSWQQIYQELELQSKNNDSKNRLYKLSLLYQLLSCVIIPNNEQQSSPKRLVLQPAVEYLENNYDDPNLNNTLLSKKSVISEVYFRKLFKEEYGVSPKQYIQNMRINKAKELLKSEYLTVTTIAEMVGYSSIYHFSNAFKIQAGCTPSEYRSKDKQ